MAWGLQGQRFAIAFRQGPARAARGPFRPLQSCAQASGLLIKGVALPVGSQLLAFHEGSRFGWPLAIHPPEVSAQLRVAERQGSRPKPAASACLEQGVAPARGADRGSSRKGGLPDDQSCPTRCDGAKIR